MMNAHCRVLALAMAVLLSSVGMAQSIVGHRGASADAPENTLAAFQLAWQQEADGIEGDFYFTRDRQVVCIHDADTLRTGGTKLSVADSTLAELRKLEYGAWKDPQFKGEPLPTFAQVLAIVPRGKLFVIELKTGPEIVPLIADALKADIRSGSGREYLFISFKESTIAKCKEVLPAIRAHWLTGFKQNKTTLAWTPDAHTIAKTVADCHADGVGMQGERSVVTGEFIEQLQRGHVGEFHVWTVDKAGDARYFRELGAVGITTNRPRSIRKALNESNTAETN